MLWNKPVKLFMAELVPNIPVETVFHIMNGFEIKVMRLGAEHEGFVDHR